MSLSRAHHLLTSPPYILSPTAVHHLQRPQTRESHLRQLKALLAARPLLLHTSESHLHQLKASLTARPLLPQAAESHLHQLKVFLAARPLLLQTGLHSPAPQLVTHQSHHRHLKLPAAAVVEDLAAVTSRQLA